MKTKGWVAIAFIMLIMVAAFVTIENYWVSLALLILFGALFIAYRMSQHSDLSDYDRRQEERRKGR